MTSIVGLPGGRAAIPSDRPGSGRAAAKLALRDQLLTARNRRSLAEVGERAPGRSPTHLLAAPEVRRAATVAAYVSVGSEPGTGPLLDGLAAAGKRVILPVLLPDNDLDWAPYHGDGLAGARPAAGCSSRSATGSGPDAVATADVVLVPGLAVSPTGCGSAAAAAPTTGRSAGCRSAPSPACCSTTTRSASTTSPPSRTTGRWSPPPATERGRHGCPDCCGLTGRSRLTGNAAATPGRPASA